MTKGKLIIVLLAFILISSMLVVSVSADLYTRESIDKSYTSNYDIWEYSEDLRGGNKGFSIKHYWKTPEYHYEYEDDYPYITWGYVNTRDDDYYKYYNRNRYQPYYRDYYDDYDYYYDIQPVLNTYRLGRDRKYIAKYGWSRDYSSSYPYYGSRPSGYNRNYW